MRGNLVDIAVAFVLGGAFGRVVSSFTDGIVAPLIGMLGGADLASWKYVLKAAATDTAGNATPEVAVMYGSFLAAILDFIIVAFVMFMLVKGINKMKKQEAPAAPPGPSAEEKLLTEIRDLLKK